MASRSATFSLILALLVPAAVWSGDVVHSAEEVPTAGDADSPTSDEPDQEADVDPFVLPPLEATASSAATLTGVAAAEQVRGRVFAVAEQRREVARTGSLDASARLADVTAALATSAATMANAGSEIDSIQFSHRELVNDHRDAAKILERRLAAMYVAGPGRVIDDLVDGYDLSEARSRQILFDAVLAADQARLVETYTAATTGVIDVGELALDLSEDRDERALLVKAHLDVSATAEHRALELARAEQLTDDLAFPVGGEHSFVDTFLAPRMAGTPDVHRHQGIDIFAELGTPLVAVERGIVVRVGEVRLGGLRVWLIGESGAEYYYAHLSAHADITEGQFVETGTVLGYVGTTGNARGTFPHVHFQFHPGGGSAVNAYPLLDQLRHRDEELVDDGGLPYGLCLGFDAPSIPACSQDS